MPLFTRRTWGADGLVFQQFQRDPQVGPDLPAQPSKPFTLCTGACASCWNCGYMPVRIAAVRVRGANIAAMRGHLDYGVGARVTMAAFDRGQFLLGPGCQHRRNAAKHRYRAKPTRNPCSSLTRPRWLRQEKRLTVLLSPISRKASPSSKFCWRSLLLCWCPEVFSVGHVIYSLSRRGCPECQCCRSLSRFRLPVQQLLDHCCWQFFSQADEVVWPGAWNDGAGGDERSWN